MQIDSLQESIMQLKDELHTDKNGTIYTRLDIIFMSSAATDFASLDPTNLPKIPTSLDIWVLRDQSIILTKKMLSDEAMNLQFESFIDSIKTTFGQTITVQKQPFNQALILKNKEFAFVRMDSKDTYSAKKTKKLTKLTTLFAQIISQELSFLNQLTSFTDMLHDAKIFTTPVSTELTPESATQVSKPKRSISQFDLPIMNDSNYQELKMSNVFNVSLIDRAILNRTRRNIFDIFTPYSINDLGTTANQNYKLMNRNFKQIHITEEKLSHAQRTLHEQYNTLNTKEMTLFRKELYLELRTLKTTFYSDFIFDLQEILKTNSLDKSYVIVFELLRSIEYCNESKCYSLPIFSILDNNVIQITVQAMSQTLSKAEYVSCTILANERTSIYSHQLAILRDNKLHFQMDHLPSVTLTQLKEPQIDARTRLISEEDKLAQIFYPIYMNERVSLQCLIPQHIEIDGEARYCDPHSLQFGPFPREIKVNGKIVLALHIPHHFSMKLAYMAEDFTSISLFKETNDNGSPFGQEIIGFFETAQPIHYSLFGMSIIVIIVLFTLFCCASSE